MEFNNSLERKLQLMEDTDNVEFLKLFYANINDELSKKTATIRPSDINSQIKEITTAAVYVGFDTQLKQTGSFHSASFLKEIVDIVEGDAIEGSPIQKYLKRNVTISTFNKFFRERYVLMKMLLKDILVNYPYDIPLLEKKHSEYFTTKILESTTVDEWGIQRYSKELEGHRRKRWKKVSMVVERAYQEENYFLIAQILKECYPHIFKRTYSSVDEYGATRGEVIPPSEGINELLAYFYLYNLPEVHFKHHVDLTFYADLTEVFIQQFTYRDYLRYDIFGYTIEEIEKFDSIKHDNLSPDINAVYNNKKHIKDTGLNRKYMKYSPYLVPHEKNENLCELIDDKIIRFHDLILTATFYTEEHEENLRAHDFSHFLMQLAGVNYYGKFLQDPVTTYDLMMINEILRKQENITGDENRGREFIAVIHYYVSTIGSLSHSREIVFYDTISDKVGFINENNERDEQALQELFELNKESVYASDIFLDELNKEMLSLKIDKFEKSNKEYQNKIKHLSKSLDEYKTLYEKEKQAFRNYKKEVAHERKEMKQFQQEKYEIIKNNERLTQLVEEQEKEKKELLQEIERLKEKLAHSFENALEQPKDVQTIKNELVSYLKSNQIAIVGGHTKWQNKLLHELSEVADNINVIDIDKRVVLDFLDTTKHIFIVSKYNNHGYSYQVDRNKKPHNEIHYLDTTNIEHTLREMHETLFED